MATATTFRDFGSLRNLKQKTKKQKDNLKFDIN